jgi:hypothetical protein
MLDFFGVPVKAQDLLNLLAQVRLLSKRIDALEASGQELPRSFRLEAASTPPQAKWGRAVGWGPRDDAMLLLGVYWHGVGHWEAIARDERLGLSQKMASVLTPPPGGGSGGSGAQKTPVGTPPPGAAPGSTPPPPPGAAGGSAVAATEGDGAAEGGKGVAKDVHKELLPKGGSFTGL